SSMNCMRYESKKSRGAALSSALRSRRSGRGGRYDVDVLPIARAREGDAPLGHGEDRVVAADHHALTRVELRPALANDDVSGDDVLAAVALHAEPLRVGVATVARRAGALLGREQLQIEPEHSRDTIPDGRAAGQTRVTARRVSTRIRTPRPGRSVTSGSGGGGAVSSGRSRKRRANRASTRTASVQAKPSPMQIRLPPPNGKYAPRGSAAGSRQQRGLRWVTSGEISTTVPGASSHGPRRNPRAMRRPRIQAGG